MHMKKTKFAMLLVMVLVFALQSVGMMPAGAEEPHAPITSSKWYAKDVSLTNLVGYMGPVSQYGVITEHYIQGGHSEANVFADKITREPGRTDPFLASGDTVNATKDSHVQATLTLPEVHVADEMTFGLFYLDDSGNLVEVAHEGSNHRITVDVAGQTAVQLVFPAVTCHDHMMENLYIRQIENDLPVDPQNTDGMKITYGPPVISERRNALYLGDITYTGDDVFNLFQNANDVGVCDVMELGAGIKLYRKTGDNTFEPITPGTSVGGVVDSIYIHDDSWPADSKYPIINNLIFDEDGKFKLSESKYEIDVVYLEKPAEGKKNKAEELLDDLAELSYKLSNSELGIGGALKDGMKLGDLPVEGGNSTVTGSTEDGAVLSLYHAGLTATSTSEDYYVDMSMLAPTSPQTGWANGGLPIADNEYVIINVVVGGPDGVLHLNDQGLELSLRNSDGTQHKTNMWRSVSNLSFSRVIWNPVYWDEGSNTYQPFQGTVLAGNTHGGVVLAPYADIDQPSVGDSVTLIGESVHNSNGQEIHQTSFQGARTFVRMINEPTTEVRGKKIWKGDKESDRPAKIEITLWIVKEGGNVAVATHEVTAEDNWEWSFTNLPKVQDGKAIEYTITERPVSHYDAPVIGQQTEKAEGNDRIITQDVTNTYNEDITVVSGSKIWKDADDQDEIRPDKITVRLYACWAQQYNGYVGAYNTWEPYSEKLAQVIGDMSQFSKDDELEVTAADNWSWCFDRLPAKTYYEYWMPNMMGGLSKQKDTYVWKYKVVEEPVPEGYESTDSYEDGEYNITNTHRPSKISIKVNKFWLDSDNELKKRPDYVNLTVRRKIEGGNWENVQINQSVNGGSTQLSAATGWSVTYTNLPSYDAQGNLYTYDVVETQVPTGYWPEYFANTDTNGNVSVTMYNIFKTVQLKGYKVWDPYVPDSMKPQKLYIDIMRDVRASGEIENDPSNDIKVAELVAQPNEYTWSITLPAEDASGNVATYYPVEQLLPGYEASADMIERTTEIDYSTGADLDTYTWKITNELITVDVSATKVWEDVDNVFNTRPTDENSKLTFEVKRRLLNGESAEWQTIGLNGLAYQVVPGNASKDQNNPKTQVTVKELEQANNVITFSGLPQCDKNGNEYEYTIVESQVPNQYEMVAGDPKADNNGDFSVTITNRLKDTISGTKVWRGEGFGPNAFNARPDEITLYLKYNGETVATTTATKPDYKWEFTGIPENLTADEMAKFTVEEKAVPGYVSEPVTVTGYTGNEIVNIKAGASAELNIEKTVESAHSNFELPEGLTFTFQVVRPSGAAGGTGPADGCQIVNDGKTTADFSDEWVTVQGASVKAVQKTDGRDPDFDPIIINFTEEGTYVFQVSEVVDEKWSGHVKYDPAVYTVTYTVRRGNDGKLKVEPRNPVITKNGGSYQLDHLTFTNRYDMVNIKGSKLWEDEDAGLRLKIDAGTFKSTYLKLFVNDAETPVTVDDLKAWGATCTVDNGTNGSFSWSYNNLPAYDAMGDMITYAVKEMTVNGYQTFYVNRKDGVYKDRTDGIYGDYTLPENTSVANNIYNVLSESELTIEKTVENEGKAQIDTAVNFTITPADDATKNAGYHFYEAGANGKIKVDAEGKPVEIQRNADGSINASIAVNTSDAKFSADEKLIVVFDNFEGESKTFKFIVKETGAAPAGWTYDTSPKTVVFTVMRNQSAFEPSDSPTMSQPVIVAMDSTSGGTASFNNTYKEEEKTDVIITKFWANETFASKDKVPNIADKLTLCKLVNGNPVKVENAPTPTHEATDADRSVYTWSGLPKYDENGNEIEYVVVEQKMPGYEQYYFGADGRLIDGGTYAPNGGAVENGWQTTDVIITKVWVGGPLVDSDISNDLALYANGKHVNKAPEKDSNRYAWYDLPKYDEKGKLIAYTVKESGIPGYVVSYEPLHVGEDADQEGAKDFAFAGETITNTYYQTKGKVEFDGVKVLKGRDMKAGEFTFILTDVHGNEIQRVTNAADGSFTFDAIEFTAEDVPYGESLPAIYRIYEAEGDLPGMTYDPTEYVIELLLTDNKAGKIIVEPVGGSLPEIKFVNTYEEKVYEAKGEVEFDGVKVLNGRDMKAGEFTFILTDKAGKELQRVTNAADGTFAFEPIKYTEKDVPYGKDAEFTYYITELAGNLPGVTYDTTKYEIVVGLWDDAKGTIHVGDISECVNEIVFTNTYEAEGSVTFKGAKFLLGREFKQGDEFTFELLNEKGDVIDTVTINPTSGTKADFAFKTIKYELADAGKTYTYTYRVKEKAGAEEGMTYDDTVHTVTVKVSDAGDGTLKVEASKTADALNFTNTYLAEGTVLFSGTKTMNGKALEGKDFTFVLTDADGKEIETVTNDKDGKIVFSAIQYKLEDAGKTFTYKVSEKNDGKKSVTYDDTVYTVTVKVEDAGNGHLKVTASDNATKLNFTNSYEAKAILTMNAYKTVNGYKPSVNQVYDFVLLCDDGTEMKAQNKDEVITFGTIGFDEEDVGKTFIYTVKETTEANELLEVDAAIYQVAVTVVDNGDGNLKLETEILKDGKRANGVVFANTATATLAISKTVKGPGPDKAFDLKVTFIGVDGKELEGVYDYDGDVKGTITSGGVIALKDGQSVTIVGLPEGATYTVEENAGPAYTVTVNGKPIAKAEGTLVGHGKLEFINTVEVTTFSVTKVWEGTDLGEITLTLYADGKQITPQPEVTREGDKYTYYNLPKYNEEGEEIVYSAKERGIDGYIRIYNNVEPYQDVTSSVHDGGTIINREIQEEVHELSFKIHKVWTGVEATEEIPAITLTLYCNGEKLDVPTPKPDSEGWYRYYDLPKTVNGQIAVYTVVEEPIPGYTVTYKTASGEVVEEGVNGGEIINAKIPQTGDPATLGLWLALMGASAVLLTMLQRRRKA